MSYLGVDDTDWATMRWSEVDSYGDDNPKWEVKETNSQDEIQEKTHARS